MHMYDSVSGGSSALMLKSFDLLNIWIKPKLMSVDLCIHFPNW